MIRQKIPLRIIHFDVIDSTMDEARRMIEKSSLPVSSKEMTVISADEQTRGRGRQNRDWVSDKGNLYTTFVLDVSAFPEKASQVSFVTALAVSSGIQPFLKPEVNVGLKWPNDVLINDRKVAGILLELVHCAKTNTHWLLVGIGVNICFAPSNVKWPATFLNKNTKDYLSRNTVLDSILNSFYKYYDLWENEGFEIIRANWLDFWVHRDKEMSVQLGRESVKGHLIDLDDTGCLLVKEMCGRITKIWAGDVRFPHD